MERTKPSYFIFGRALADWKKLSAMRTFVHRRAKRKNPKTPHSLGGWINIHRALRRTRERGIFNSFRAISSRESDWNQDPRAYMRHINYLAIQLRDRSPTGTGNARTGPLSLSLRDPKVVSPRGRKGGISAEAAYYLPSVPRNTVNFHGAAKSGDIEYPLSRRP